MNNLIEKIYMAQLEDIEIAMTAYNLDQAKQNARWELHNTLTNALPKEKTKLLNDYVDMIGARHCAEEENAFRNGFTAGALLMIEIFENKR